jgi:hypothetical protein
MRLLSVIPWFVTLSVLLTSPLACGGEARDGDDDDGGGPSSGAGAAGTTGSAGAGTGEATSSSGPSASGNGGAGTGGSGDDGAPRVDLTISGDCTPDFGGNVVVATNSDSIAVYSQNGGGGSDSSIQLALQGASGLQQLSTQHRVNTGIVINLIDDGTTWTNIASFEPDPVGGTLDIVHNDQGAGIVEVSFSGTTLVLLGTEPSYCVIDGTLETFGEYYGP